MDIRYTIKAFPSVIYLFLLFLAVLLIVRLLYRTKFSMKQMIWGTVMAVYLSGIAYFVFFPIHVNIGIYESQNAWYKAFNWIPILTLDVKTFMLNIVMLMPLGVLWPLVRGSVGSWKEGAKAAFFLSVGIEGIQFIITQTLGSGRSSDINDLIANTLGGIAGYGVLTALLRVKMLRRLLLR